LAIGVGREAASVLTPIAPAHRGRYKGRTLAERAMSVYLLGTLDTKGTEIGFVRDRLQAAGVKTTVVDTGCQGTPTIPADVPREQVFAAAGVKLADVQAANDRGQAVTQAAAGAANLIAADYARGNVSGVLGLGGSAGTTIGTAAMRALPLGVPKLMVSTLASGQTRPYVGGKDILMMNSVVDIAGINRISRAVLGNAAAAMAGMVSGTLPSVPDTFSASEDRPLIAATMFGVTTPCVNHARQILEAAGYEVLVFHATGNGGEAMEGLIADGLIAGVLDITTTELADELVGGVLSAGPTRLTAAGKCGTPQAICVGALDMVNFGPRPTVPEKFRDRLFYQHNPTVTLMRTTVDENRALGEEIGRKAAAATGPTAILLPQRGVSAIDADGKPFHDPAAREALFAGIRATCGSVEVMELDRHINDPEFAAACAERLLAMLGDRPGE
jgi:uncharacterized protein (UPF0261 family)